MSTAATPTPIGTVHAILAIGTEEQIAFLKRSRSLSPCRSFLRAPPESFPNLENVSINTQNVINPNANVETQTNCQLETIEDQSSQIGQTQNAADRQANLAAMLSNFIDNLASRLPERNNNPINDSQQPLSQSQSQPQSQPQSQLQTLNTPVDTFSESLTTQQQKSAPNHTPNLNQMPKLNSGTQIRATSDLLDELQRALTVAPPILHGTPFHRMPTKTEQIQSSLNQMKESIKIPQFHVLIEIENALHLSTILIRVNKKCGKRGRDPATQSTGLPQRGGNVNEIEPSTYVTFEAFGPPTSVVNSSEGPVYTTNVADSSCSPQWNKRFEVYLPIDLLLDVS